MADLFPQTFLKALVLSDIVGSTSITESVGDARAAQIIASHDKIVRELVAEHGGDCENALLQ